MHKFKQVHEELHVRRMDASLSNDCASPDRYAPVAALKTRVILRLDTGGRKQFRVLWSGYKPRLNRASCRFIGLRCAQAVSAFCSKWRAAMHRVFFARTMG